MFLTLLALFSFMTLSSFDEIEVGKKAPLFQAVDSQGKDWNLKDYIGKSYVVLYFYPAAMTGGCTQQACAYRDQMNEFETVNAKVVGISGDNVEGLRAFRESQNLNFDLVSDADGAIAKKYGVPVREGGSIERNISGQAVTLTRGVTISRWTYIINQKGNIIYKKADVNAGQDSSEALAAIKKDREQQE